MFILNGKDFSLKCDELQLQYHCKYDKCYKTEIITFDVEGAERLIDLDIIYSDIKLYINNKTFSFEFNLDWDKDDLNIKIESPEITRKDIKNDFKLKCENIFEN